MSQWIVSFLKPYFESISEVLTLDTELSEAFASTAEIPEILCFAIVAATDAPFLDNAIVVRFQNIDQSFQASVEAGTIRQGIFALNAKPEHWERFFQYEFLTRPYQSYWGMLRILGGEHVFVSGNTSTFAKFAKVWRISLDRMRLVVVGKAYNALIPSQEQMEDAITGKYVWIDHNEYGKVKIFYEYAGSGSQHLLFLHTAGSDSRQYHSLMNDASLQERCKMFAFDLPGHGRSSLGTTQSIEGYKLTEASYIESISRVIQTVGINGTVVCGASMAGHVCIALAIRARELGIRGAIPCEGCAHLPQPAAIYDMQGSDSSILDPERVCGMIAPTSPEYYKRQIWWQYSSQATGVFKGDLKFYFKGWDGRDRLKEIDTSYCPVYMLTGEYDYSCTTEASKETAESISGAVFEAIPGLGHFPLTENPQVILPYLHKALDYIHERKSHT